MVRVCLFVKSLTQQQLNKQQVPIGQGEGEDPRAGQMERSAEGLEGGQGPGRQCLGPAPTEGRQGWPAGHQQGISLACPALVTPQPSAGHQHWDREYHHCSRLRLGADQLKNSEPSHKQTLKEERTWKKPRHPRAGIEDNGEQGPTLHGASVTPVPASI